MSGLWGRILRVNLSQSTVKEEAIPEEWIRNYVGGRGLASRYLIEEVPKGADPLGPQNILIFMAGLLTGTASPTASKHVVVAKSPLTGIIGMSISGGFWATKLKKSGFDGIIFEGISPKPVYLVIEEGAAELRDAGHLWGKNVFETIEKVRDDLDEGFGVTCIGTAGENLVKYAAIIDNDERAAGRCGLGAVMGSKRLKAIAVKGSKKVPIADEKAFKESEKINFKLVDNATCKLSFQGFGTPLAVDLMNIKGYFPYKNWQTSYIEDIEGISGNTYIEQIFVGPWGCNTCTIKCARKVEVKEGKYNGFKGRGPEYETVWVWGGSAAINDIEAIAVITHLCNDYGIDTMSCGSTVAFAMECYEKGILTRAETDGLDIKFGDAAAAIALIPKIARREGFGDLMAEGTRIMAKILGRDTERFAMNVKGLELPGYECRGAHILGLAYSVGSRGGCHNMAECQLYALADIPCNLIKDTTPIKDRSVADPVQVQRLFELENASTVIDCLGSCKFIMGDGNTYKEILKSISNVIGREFTYDEFKRLGERVWNMERVFNVREGIGRTDDNLPKRLLEEPLTEGLGQGHVTNIDMLLDHYYELRGWDKNGIPTYARLRELKIEDLIECLSQ